MNVEQPGKQWEAIRNIYLTILIQGKIATMDGPHGQIFNLQAKALKISQILIKNQDGEEMDLEQMLIQSMVNLQLENFKREFKSKKFDPNTKIFNMQPEEIACFGVWLSNIDLTFGKSQLSASWFWKQVEQADRVFCKRFFESIVKHQEEIVKQMHDENSDLNETFKALKKAHGNKIDELDKKISGIKEEL